MIEDGEALKHQQNAAPGEKQTLANTLKQQGRREQEGIETRCLRFGTRNSSLKAFEKMAGSPARRALLPLSSTTASRKSLNSRPNPCPKQSFLLTKNRQKASGIQISGEKPLFFSKKIRQISPSFNPFGESVVTGLSRKLHI